MNSNNGGHTTNSNDVAIVGMACVFPGAPDVNTYWRNIVSKVDAISDPPADWDADVFYDPASRENDRVYCQRGGYLHDLASFDPLEYGVMPTSIDGGEPDHFLALRVAHEALHDAGYRRDAPGSIKGDRIEVILGRGAYINRGFTNLVQHGLIIDQTLRLLKQLHPEHTPKELEEIRLEMKTSLPPFNSEMAPGLVPNILSGRIANRLDLMGPNFTIDAACASSHIAVERAIQDLVDGRCDMALTGGIHCSSPPPIFMVFCQLNALSRRGKIQPFSEDADGTLLGEGLGMIVLKRAADALRDGDRVYALIKAVGTASDGRALGLLAPRVEGEELAMRRAYEASGISPSSIGLLEAHGTGTAVGDQTEAEALIRLFGSRRGRPPSCALGSVKSMISHLIPAAGIAGIIKSALALHYKILPPTLNCERPNAKLGLDDTPLFINSETRPWIHGRDTPRRAGVNAFGFGGINAHAILEEFIPSGPAPVLDGGPPWDSEAVILHAHSRTGLVDKCKRLGEMISNEGLRDLALCDLAYSVNCEEDLETAGDVCLSIVASSVADFKNKLAHSLTRLDDSGCTSIKDFGGIYYTQRMLSREGKVAFLFPGEGSQYLNMFADLCLHMPPVRARFDLVDQAFQSHPRGWIPSQVVFPPPLPNDSETRQAQELRLQEMDFAAEAVFAANQGMFDLLSQLKIHPDVVAGHSGGEISSLLAAGVIRVNSDADLLRHIAEINQLYLSLLTDGLVPDGCAFAVSGAERDAVLKAIQKSGCGLRIGMDNCPHQVVLCGKACSADALVKTFREVGALCSPLPFQRPYHTPDFEPYCSHIRPFFDRLEMGRPRVPVYCGATAKLFPEDPEDIRELAARQTALPVRFRETIEAMHKDGVRIFVEVGPKGILTSFVDDTLRSQSHLAIASDVPSVPSILQLNRMLAQLAAQGVSMRMDPLYEQRSARRISLDGSARPGMRPKHGVRVVTGLTHMRLNDQPRSWNAEAQVPITHIGASNGQSDAVTSRTPYSALTPTSVPVPRESCQSWLSNAELSANPPMQAYLNSMDQFLHVQEEVMRAYLTSSRLPAIDSDSMSGALTSRTGAGQITTHRPSEAVAPLRANPDRSVENPTDGGAKHGSNGHGTAIAGGSLLMTLLDVISERTGYPPDMLRPSLNLEADLGIDSIKRVEILGVLQHRTGLFSSERMEFASSLKTIAEIEEFLKAGALPAPTPSKPKLPLVGDIESHEPGIRVVFVRKFDPAHDLFLKDHALGGRVSSLNPELTGLPLIPLTITMEMMAEAASLLLPGGTLIGMNNVRGSRWLALDRGEITLRVVAYRSESATQHEVRVEVNVDGETVPVAEAVAVFGDGYPDPPPSFFTALRSSRPSKWTPDRLYRDHMFHGPSFRGIESIQQWGEDGLSGTLVSLPLSEFFRNHHSPVLLADPVMIDAAGQMIGYWAAEHLSSGFNVFPYRIDSLRLYAPPLTESQRAACRMRVRNVGESQIHADIDVSDQQGRLLMRIQNWEDLRVDLPENFYRLCISARGVFMSEVCNVNPHVKLCSLELTSLPSLTVHGGIWLRALAHATLSERERQTWAEMAGPERRRVEWLMGRCCAKDAVRNLVRQSGQSELLPADVEIVPDEHGRPRVAGVAVRPSISISHADGVAIAAATLQPGLEIGVDVQRLDPTRDGYEGMAFNERELALLPSCDFEERREILLRLWCAKEAAAKALGYGMLGGPGSIMVLSLDALNWIISVQVQGILAERFHDSATIDVETIRQGDLIIATCLYQRSKEIHELSKP